KIEKKAKTRVSAPKFSCTRLAGPSAPDSWQSQRLKLTGQAQLGRQTRRVGRKLPPGFSRGLLLPSRTIRWRKPTRRGVLGLSLWSVLAAAGWAQASPVQQSSRTPIDTEIGFLQSQGAQPRFEAASKISPQAMAAVEQQRIAC